MADNVRSRVRNIFLRALEISPEGRRRFAEAECGEDTALRADVLSLLSADEKASALGSSKGLRAERDNVAQSAFATAEHVEKSRAGSRAPTHDLLGSVISHYRVEKRLGAGGMGEVYLAHDLALDRRVALKVLAPGFSPSTRDRLVREAWTSSRVQHPAIATFQEAGQADGIDFIAMEYVEGKTLREELRGGPLSMSRSIDIVGTVLEGLVHAHFWGILHRDIKPENIMIAANGAAKLLDFGLAKGLLMEEDGEGGATSSEPVFPAGEVSNRTLVADVTREESTIEELAGLTRVGGIVGTPGYMPPEQLRGERLDVRADVFAAGVVLYEVLQGAPAFPGKTLRERCHSILHRDPAPLVGPEVSDELRTIVARSLARDRSDRYPSAAAMLADLRQAGGDEAHSTRSVRLAIRDFRDLAPDDDGGWIGIAVHEALTTNLGSLPRVTMAPRETLPVRPRPSGPPATFPPIRGGARSIIARAPIGRAG